MKTAIALAAVVALANSAAAAQTVTEPASVHVRYADLDLRQPQARAELDRRVGAAVIRVCRAPAHADLVSVYRFQDCRRSAWAKARVQLAQIYGQTAYAELAPRLATAR